MLNKIGDYPTLIDLLSERAWSQADRRAYTFLSDGENEQQCISYFELDQKARAIGAHLESLAAGGERALLLFPPGLDFIISFFGCLYAGIVAVPVYPPDPARLNRTLPRFKAITEDAQPSIVLTASYMRSALDDAIAQDEHLKSMRWVTTDAPDLSLADDWKRPECDGNTPAFLQYTSGSTSSPKGVIVSHGNLIQNQRMIKQACQHTEQSTFVGWLPLYHDMGLIGNVLQPLYLGASCVLMSPMDFLRNPFCWLQAISRYKAATSGGPNFAYDLCARRITSKEKTTLDLSSWTIAFNGAEPVRQDTMERFTAAFEICGFRREAFYPCYGLAEATLFVTGAMKGKPPVSLTVKRTALENNLVIPAAPGNEGAESIVGCGKSLLDQSVVIVNPESMTATPHDQVGEVWVSGRNVALGYWNRPEETAATFQARLADTGEGPFLRTGDLGFLQDGELFVTGRLKDLVIIRGRNLYPQDIELSVERCHRALRPGSGAAFSVELAGEERLVIVQELDDRKEVSLDSIFNLIRQSVAEHHEAQPYAIALIKPGSILKTSSGKIQRRACRDAFLRGELSLIAEWREMSGSKNEAGAGLTLAPPHTSTAIQAWLVEQLAARFSLDPRDIDINQPITRYGLDSLAAIELAQSLETISSVRLLPTALLRGPSIAQLASEMMDRRDTFSASPVGRITHRQEEAARNRLSNGQQSLWFLHQLAPESAAYNIASAVSILGELDAESMRRAFQGLVNRHAQLRTTFATLDGEPVQQTRDMMEVCFRQEDASTWSENYLDARLAEEAYRPFNLEQGPLLKVCLFTLSAQGHVLLIVLHHIIADLWSLSVMAHELGILYEAEKGGHTAMLTPLRWRYVDYVRWQEAMLESEEGERLWKYWQAKLSGELPPLDLCLDRARPPVQSYLGASHSFDLSAELAERLKSLARSHDATLYMTLLAAFQALLYRYTGQEEILVGSPTACRSSSAELSGLVGYFVNPVVLRVAVSGKSSFEVLLSQTRETVLEAFDHQEYPFALLVKRMLPVRDPSRSPLFQVMFILQKSHILDEEGLATFALGEAGESMRLWGLEVRARPIKQVAAQFDLTLMMAETSEGIKASLQYNTSLFDLTTIKRMSEAVQMILQAVAGDARRTISSLSLLSGQQKHQLLTEWNPSSAFPLPANSIHDLIHLQAQRTPLAVAVSCGSAHITYAELDYRASQLAACLRASGAAAESRIGICLQRNIDMIVALLAVLKSGAAYVPLDASHPAERIAYILKQTAPELVLTSALFKQNLMAAGAHISAHLLVVDDQWQQQRPAAYGDESAANVEPDNLAYVLYTSGSTGRPKGVAIEHRSAVSLMQWAAAEFTQDELSSVLASTSIGFDLSVFEIFVPLMAGGKVIVADNALALAEMNRREEVTLINTVPSAMAELVRMRAIPDSVKTVNLAGEALTARLVEQVYEAAAVERVINLYGPTEDTTYTTRCEVRQGDEGEPSIGRPILGARVYVLDQEGGLMPVGIRGEIYIGGSGLARGYFNEPAMTAERFVPDQYSRRGGERLYRTGDIGSYREDGSIQYWGRMDDQVKVRGYRIELGEVEAALRQQEEVSDAAVVCAETSGGDKRLVAYVVSESGAECDVREMRSRLREKLPEYMVPTACVLVERMPLTSNGKVDRKALRELGEGIEERKHAREAATETEKEIMQIWREVLGEEIKEEEENFFEAGGHSLLATQVVSRIRDRFHVELGLRALFEYPTLGALAGFVEANLKTSREAQYAAIQLAPRHKPLPLSPAQQRLWFLEQLEPGNPFYNISQVVSLTGLLNIAALEQSLKEIVRRHEILRTTFQAQDGQPSQAVAAEASFTLKVIDLQRLPDDEREQEALCLASAESKRPFDFVKGPLFRTTLLRLSADRCLLLAAMHHIISDGWSMGVLLKELASLYQAFSAGKPSPLQELKLQYADFASWQQQWMQGDVLDRQLSYWKQQLGGKLSTLDLPTDRPRPATQSFRGAKHSLEVTSEQSERLRELSRREGVTLFMTLLAAFKALLHRYTQQDDLLVGSPIANRNHREIEELIGFFANTLVMRTELGGDPTFSELLARVKNTAINAYANQDLPFEKLVEELKPERDLSRNPLFQVMFVLQNAPLPALEFSGLTLRAIEIDNATTKFDLTLNLCETAQGLEGWLEYNVDLFDRATIIRLLAHLNTLMEGLLLNPEQRLSQLPLLTEAEQHQSLAEWNDTRAAYAQQECIHKLFEAQAERTPDAVAVVFEKERLTYRELNERANKLARYLLSSGVEPDGLVGICIERSIEMLVGVLAILKAGAGYVPLDPAYPKSRLADIVSDAGVKVLLTSRNSIENVAGQVAATICLEDEWELIAGQSGENLCLSLSADMLVYVIYTSGSTGKPKGIGLSHRALVNLINWNGSTLPARERTLQFASLSFDASYFETFSAWCSGGTLYLVAEDVRRDTSRLLDFLIDNRIDRATLPVVVLQQLAEEQNNRQKYATDLRDIITTGEQLHITRPIINLFKVLKKAVLHNHYGPSESHVVTAHTLGDDSDLWEAHPPVGRPIFNTQMYVLDAQLNPVPVGCIGELYIGGVSLARGYLNRPELTAEKFMPDPFNETVAGRMYRTGDFARYTPDGNIRYVGRKDHQVKVRGFRIELGEIEAVLCQHAAVGDSAVVAREDRPGDKRLVAYIVAAGEATPSIKELRGFIKERLPDYMNPGAFVLLDEFPLTANGKLDRQALPAPDLSGGAGVESYTAPGTMVEEVIAAIWGEVLGVERVGVRDNFFDLGGHSLLATRTMSRLREAFQIEMPLMALFENPTVEGLAVKIELDLKAGRVIPAAPIRPVSREADLPLSFAQQRLWFLNQLNPGSASYNLYAAVKLTGQINLDALDYAVNEIVRRHDSLRTTFTSSGGMARQMIARELRLSLDPIDLTRLQEGEKQARLKELLIEEATRPFDLARGPLIRVSIFKLDEHTHALLFAMHHIITDGWSMGVVIKELTAIYSAYLKGSKLHLPDLPIQYVDFARRQRERLQGDLLEAELSYWRRQLSDAPDGLSLPTDYPRPSLQSFEGATQAFALSKEMSEALKALSRKEGATFFMALFAAFNTLLYRYSGQEDILIGTPTAGRDRTETEGLIGFFVNMLVLRTSLSGNPTFTQLLSRVREVSLGAYTHGELPFEKLVEELHPQRDLSRNPLFQVMFALQNVPMRPMELPGLSLSMMDVENRTMKFDLSMSLTETAEGVAGLLEYNASLFSDDTVKRLSEHFRTLLDGIIANPGQRLSALPLLTEAEQRQLIVEWNDTEQSYPHHALIHELFEAVVRNSPGAVAAIHDNQSISYGQLNERANQLAHYLISLQIEPEARVGICLARGLDMIVALLGVLKAGCAYVPIDAGFPKERIAYMLEDARVKVLLTQRRIIEKLPDNQITAACLDEDWKAIARYSVADPRIDAVADNLAYVIYTSGSTGRPKGVQIPHNAVVNLLTAMSRQPGMMKEDVLLAVTTLSFDIAALELYLPLTVGACVVIAGSEAARDGEMLLNMLNETRATVMQATPATWRLLLEASGRWPDRLKVLCGGEELPRELAGRLLEKSTSVWNLYGPTETTIWSALYRVRNEDRAVPIGHPIDNTQIYILDGNLNAVPAGATGELHIGGAGLARGYINQPAMTAEKFIPNPFTREPGARLYKTGDLARYLRDGSIEFLGRIDGQVKVRGFRIELGEVEAALAQHPFIQQCVVVSREDASGGKSLVAYVVGNYSQASLEMELRSHLKERLPDYMIPRAFVAIDSLPLTANGKVDRQSLPAPRQSRSESILPRTPVEEMTAGIWAEVLGIEQVGIHENFFDLGGHSLLATQVMSRLSEAFQTGLPLRNIFESPTVGELADVIESVIKAEPAARMPILPVSRDGELPLSFAQQRLWFLNQLEPDGATYNMPCNLRLRGRLNIAALEQTISEIVRRHEVLRTSFPAIEGRPVQAISPADPVKLAVVDLTGLPETTREATVLRIASQEAQRPIDLAHGPVLRATLLRLESEDHALLFTIHHAVFDGWSIGVLVREVRALYDAFSNGEASPLAELPVQYADFAHWQREWLQGEALETHLAYWKKQLGGTLPALDLPADRPRPAAQSHRGSHWSFSLPIPLIGRLKILSRSERVTLFMTLLATYQSLLYRYTGQSDVIVGTDIANRNRVETEHLIGFFVNQLVLRTDLSGQLTFRTLLKRVREVTLGAYAHQDLPFEKLVNAIQSERDMSRAPLFQTKIVLQNEPVESLSLKDLSLTPLQMETGMSRFDLTLSLAETSEAMNAAIEYSTDLFDGQTMRRMMGHFARLLEAVADDPDRRIDDLPVLTDSELAQALIEWNDTEADYASGACIQDLFEAQVKRTPDEAALVFGDQRLTYLELNRKANQLANYLCGIGVGPEVRVGICVERSPDMVVGLLGVLKSGAAFVPLDPAYPMERLSLMIEDSSVPVLLTQERVLDAVPTHWGQIVCLDSDWELIARQSAQSPCVDVTAENLAYIIYTSGSLGRPKGVLVQHSGVGNLAEAQAKAFEVGPGSRVLQFASFSFDASVSEIFVTLLSGATLYIEPRDMLMPGPGLIRLLREHGITTVTLPPSVLAVLPEKGLPELQMVISAGEACSAEIVERWSAGRRFLNAYGPTEATVCASMTECLDGSRKPALGRPIANTRIYLLDERLHPTPIGVAGELHVAGVGLARGYLNKPEETALKFIPDPFGDEPGARLYKTGDLARYLPDGSIDFLGRCDDQVKLRGFRIEPGEIEQALGQHPAVQQCVVMAREDVDGGKRLVAYVVANRPGASIDGGLIVEQSRPLELWPSAAEYFIYDEMLYHAMTNDERRNESYRAAINKYVKGRTVLDIGTGPEAILARLCVEAGAQKVYAIEVLEATYKSARNRIRELGLDDKIILIHGDSTQVQLPEKVDVCVSEIVGPIGGVEGAGLIINDARRFLKEDGIMIPRRSITRIAAVSLPQDLIIEPGFAELPAHYVQKIFDYVGYRFDLRLCVKGASKANLVSTTDVFEDLDFTAYVQPQYKREASFEITENARMDGFLIWLNLYTDEGEVIDILEHEHCWLPVYFPAFYPGVEVSAGDRIEAVITSRLCDNNINPDYTVEGRLIRLNGEAFDFQYDSYHHRNSYRQTPFYDEVFAHDTIKVRANDQANVTANELRDHLKKRLPDYLVPSAYVLLDSMPLTPNGKVDRDALLALDIIRPRSEQPLTEARTGVEKTLAKIWAEVLNLDRVGVHDNFFELGGDSILGIRVVARAEQAGIHLIPQQLFQHQTISELAAVSGAAKVITAEQGLVTGRVPLTPIQRWFFDQNLPDPQHYNQAVLLEVNRTLDACLLESAIKHLVIHHDALRMRFERTENGWEQINSGDGENVALERVDLSHLSEPEQARAIKEFGSPLQASLDLSRGPLLRVAYFNLGAEKSGRLLIIIHHLACDAFSLRILVEDLQTIYGQLSRGERVALPPKTTSFKEWAERLVEYAQSDELGREREYWVAEARKSIDSLPVDFPGGARAESAARTISVTLSTDETSALLQKVTAAYHAHVNEILLAALARGYSSWSGRKKLLIDLEGHGREGIMEELDLSRTVGWFTSFLPVVFDLNADSDIADDLKSIKRQVRDIPNRGIGYGLLRYLRNDVELAETLRGLPEAEVSFNYFGQLDEALAQSSAFALATEDVGPNQSLLGTRTHALEINGGITGGRLFMNWTYCETIFLSFTVERLAAEFIEGLRLLIARCQSTDASADSSPDFSLVNLDEHNIDDLLGKVEFDL